MEKYLDKNLENLKNLCSEGLLDKYKLIIDQISIPLTNRCNGYCIMCHACNIDYKNRTYYNAFPYEISLRNFKKIIRPPKKSLLKMLLRMNLVYESEPTFVFGTAETLLNNEIYDILKYTKNIYPNCKIRLISNGTIQPNPGEIVQYIDRIGFSVDGCTPETFEYLRTPAKFDHVMSCIRKWDHMATKHNKNFSFGFGTVISSANIHELGGIVKLASTFRHIDSVFVQPINLYGSKSHLSHLLLKELDLDDLKYFINEAKHISEEVGVRIDGIDSILSPLSASNEKNTVTFENSMYCRYMWNGIISLTETGEFRYFCCYMEKKKQKELMMKYNIRNNCSLDEMYNSKNYWLLRKDMLEGKLISYCEGCNQSNTGYKLLSEKIVEIGEKFYL